MPVYGVRYLPTYLQSPHIPCLLLAPTIWWGHQLSSGRGSILNKKCRSIKFCPQNIFRHYMAKNFSKFLRNPTPPCPQPPPPLAYRTSTRVRHICKVLGKFSMDILEFISRTQKFWNGFAPSHAHQLGCYFKWVLVTQAIKLRIDQISIFFCPIWLQLKDLQITSLSAVVSAHNYLRSRCTLYSMFKSIAKVLVLEMNSSVSISNFLIF